MDDYIVEHIERTADKQIIKTDLQDLINNKTSDGYILQNIVPEFNAGYTIRYILIFKKQ